MRRRFSVTGSEVDGDEDDGDHGCKYGSEHDDDEPGGAVCRLWRGLGNPHGVDKGVRDELDELHVSSMVNWGDSSRNQCSQDVSARAESEGSGVHLLSQDLWVEGLPERGQAHTLKDV